MNNRRNFIKSFGVLTSATLLCGPTEIFAMSNNKLWFMGIPKGGDHVDCPFSLEARSEKQESRIRNQESGDRKQDSYEC